MLPVLPHVRMSLSSRDLRRIRRFAGSLLHTQPVLIADRPFAGLQATDSSEGNSLLVDDLSSTALAERHPENVVLQERAVLRATAGDVVVTCSPPQRDFETYCRDKLRLGEVEWQHVRTPRDPTRVSISAWTDRSVRHRLVHLLRSDRLHYLHPYAGDHQAWMLARLLQSASRRPVRVIGPLPGLCRLVNDKAWFARTVQGLFGARYLPRTLVVYNVAGLAKVISRLADSFATMVVKLPDSSGGAGNVRLTTSEFRKCAPGRIRTLLRERLPLDIWQLPRRMIVSCWQTDVVCSPSVQMWIPPPDEGPPVLEGIFEQLIDDQSMKFRGSRRAMLPDPVAEGVAERCLMLAVLFQQLGYLGRCSFDLLLTGTDIVSSRPEFIECNGRWGGTSIPMALMNRLVGDWAARPYMTRRYLMDELRDIRFPDLFRALADSLFDPVSKEGFLVLMNASGVGSSGRLDVLAVGETWPDVEMAICRDIPDLLRSVSPAPGYRSRIVTDRVSSTASTEPSGTGCQSSWLIGSDASTTAR